MRLSLGILAVWHEVVGSVGFWLRWPDYTHD